MPCFILVHQPIGEFTQERLLECGRKLMSSLPKNVKWRQGWYVPENDSLICYWDAPSAGTVSAMLEEAGLSGLFPLVKIEEAIELPPEWLAAKKPRGRPRKVRK